MVYSAISFLYTILLVFSLSRAGVAWAAPRAYTFDYMGVSYTMNLSCDLDKIPSPPPIVLSGEEHYNFLSNPWAKMAAVEKNHFQKWVGLGELRMGIEGKYNEDQVSPGQFPLEDALFYASTVTLAQCQVMKDSSKELRRFKKALNFLNDEDFLEHSEDINQTLQSHLRPIREGYLEMFKRIDLNEHVKEQLEKVLQRKLQSVVVDFEKHQFYDHWKSLFPNNIDEIKAFKEKFQQIEESVEVLEGQCLAVSKGLVEKTSGGQRKIFAELLQKVEKGTATQVDLDRVMVDLRNVVFVEKILEQYCQDANSRGPRPVVVPVGMMHLWGMFHVFNLVDPEYNIPLRMRIYGTAPHLTLLRENGIQSEDHPLFTINILRTQGATCSHSTNVTLNKLTSILSDLQKVLNNITLEESERPLAKDLETRKFLIRQRFNVQFFKHMSKDFFNTSKRLVFDTMYLKSQQMLNGYLNTLEGDEHIYEEVQIGPNFKKALFGID